MAGKRVLVAVSVAAAAAVATGVAVARKRDSSPIETTVEIDLPSEQVFAYATDPSRFVEWQDDVVSVSGGTSSLGGRFTTVRRTPVGQRSMTFEVSESVQPTRWGYRSADGPVRADYVLAVEPLAEDTRSRVTARIAFDGHGPGKLLVPLLVRPLAAKRVSESYQHLKERLET